MIGTIEVSKAIPEQRFENAMRTLKAMKDMGPGGRKEFNKVYSSYQDKDRFGEAFFLSVRALKRASDLSKEFKMVDRDLTALRKVKCGRYSSDTMEIPLIFYTSLPAKIKTTLRIERDRNTYEATAITPMPTTEALAQIKKHKSKFDDIELWWVPNDVLVEKIPDPDPIVVGVIKIPDNTKFYYELHRWIDESVEVGWWSKEGY